MKFMNIFKFLIVSLVLGSVNSLRIPEFLVGCYQGNETEPFSANTLQLFVDLVRKIENHFPNGVDIRYLSVKLFHDLRIDGIERAPGIDANNTDFAPYGPVGLMGPKLEVLRRLISNVPGTIDYSILSRFELCALHRLLSSSVEPYERKNEIKSCPKEAINESYSNRRKINMFIQESKIHQGRNKTTRTFIPALYSRCPIEMGVIRTNEFGTISPGIVVASIAAGLQPQNVKIKDFLSEFGSLMADPYEHLETMEEGDARQKIQKLFASLSTVDNRYATGLVSDLAEVVLYQVPYLGNNSTIGFEGSWNDTNFPRVFYLHGNKGGNWEMTDSEILTGIDSIFLSQEVSSWIQRIRKMRLSQIVEMFYSHRGIPISIIENASRLTARQLKKQVKRKRKRISNDIEEFISEEKSGKYFNAESHAKLRNAFDIDNEDIKRPSKFSSVSDVSSACHRKKIFNVMDKEQLLDEVFNFVQILQFARHSVIMSNDLLKLNCELVVNKFLEYAKKKLNSLPACQLIQSSSSRPAIDLTVVIDGSRTEYENLQIISRVTEIADVSYLGSNISVIHGYSGNFIVNSTNSVSNMFEQLRNFLGPYPISLSLSRSLKTVLYSLVNQTEMEKQRNLYGGLSKVVLIFCQSQKVTEVDFESAKRIIQGSLLQFPDLYFIFVTNSVETFMQMTGLESISNHARFMQDQERYQFISSNSIDPKNFEKSLIEAFKVIPKKITSPFCKLYSERPSWAEVTMRHEFEEYLTPGEEIQYRIHPYYLKNTEEVRILFQGVDYGDFTVCMSRDKHDSSKDCKSVEGLSYTWFNISYPCYFEDDDNVCKGIYFTVNMDNTNLKCSENDCRFPDQVRYIVRPEGLRCEFNSSVKITLSSIIFYLMLFLMTLSYNF